MIANLRNIDEFYRCPIEISTKSCYFYPTSVTEWLVSVYSVQSKRFNKDAFQPFLSKPIFQGIAAPLKYIFVSAYEKALDLAIKHARVVSIFKEGDWGIVSNYRPISIIYFIFYY